MLVFWLCCQVTAAVTKQLETLNTNSRYLHDKLVVLAERITQKMPEPLRVGPNLQITLCLTRTIHTSPRMSLHGQICNICFGRNSSSCIVLTSHMRVPKGKPIDACVSQSTKHSL